MSCKQLAIFLSILAYTFHITKNQSTFQHISSRISLKMYLTKVLGLRPMFKSHFKVKNSAVIFGIIEVAHCGFLVLGNTQKNLTEIWHQFWDKNDGENICHWNYFQIPRALSELPANWPGLTSLSGWIGWAS